MALLTLAYAFNFFDRLLISLLFPLIQKDLGLTDTELGLITGVVFVLVYAILGIPVGRLADRYSRKVIIGVGFTFWSAMTFATGFVGNVWHMMATRFLMGAGESAGTPPSTSMLSDLFDQARRPLAFSILVTGTAISSLVLTPIAGWIGHVYGWRQAYFAAGAAGMVLGLLILLTVREPARGRFDGEQAVAPEDKPPLRASFSFLFGRRTFVLATIAAALNTVSFHAHLVWGTTFMLRVHGLDVAQSAALIGPIRGITNLVGAIASGVMLGWLQRRDERWGVWLPACCFVTVGVSQFLFLFAPTAALASVGVAISALAEGMMVPLMSLILVRVMPARIRTFGMATYVLIIAIVGQIVGPAGVGALNDALASIWHEEAIRYSMSVTALIGVLAGPAIFLAGKHLRKDAQAASAWSAQ
ncbi:MFS transporter [Novosphingobium sp. ERN07]|uniref:spinster family MFS transporter n=1 Tax=Novosphingobium sp. ERN07 TaxID=2726187 RepID=UPI00145784BF|nr:MFS transporter [Novosphingobium sp. ERN07]NLR73442.1 MFS transporter [Novosphingobium sp. ERN07]